MRIRSLLRDAVVFAGAVPLAPLWLLAVLERRCRLGDGFFLLCSEVLSLVPGKPGVFLRRSFYAMTLDAFAPDCHVGFGTTLAHPQVRIHRGVWIGNSSVIMADVGAESVIGAGSVVVREIPERSVAAGNPAVVKKVRT